MRKWLFGKARSVSVHKRSSDSGGSIDLDRGRQRAGPKMSRGRFCLALSIRGHIGRVGPCWLKNWCAVQARKVQSCVHTTRG